MKKLLFIFFLFPVLVWSQYPFTEQFTVTPAGWTFNNGAGIQAGYAATFNIDLIQYPSNSVVDIISPVYDFSDCNDGLIQVDFAWIADMGDPGDSWSFQYLDGTWNILSTWSNIIDFTLNNETFFVPTTTTQFKWVLTTDVAGPVRWYKNNGSWDTYQHGGFNTPVDMSSQTWSGGTVWTNFVDFDWITIDCSSVLPVELVDFSGDCDYLYWSTVNEVNSSHFTIESSINGKDWGDIGVYVIGAGNTQQPNMYKVKINSDKLHYYRLIQYDFDGDFEIFTPISIDCEISNPKIIGIYNTLGLYVGNSTLDITTGVYIVEYSDGTKCRVFFE